MSSDKKHVLSSPNKENDKRESNAKRVSFANTKLVKTYQEGDNCSTLWHSTVEETADSKASDGNSWEQASDDMLLTQMNHNLIEVNETTRVSSSMSFTCNLGKFTNQNSEWLNTTGTANISASDARLLTNTPCALIDTSYMSIDSALQMNVSGTELLTKIKSPAIQSTSTSAADIPTSNSSSSSLILENGSFFKEVDDIIFTECVDIYDNLMASFDELRPYLDMNLDQYLTSFKAEEITVPVMKKLPSMKSLNKESIANELKEHLEMQAVLDEQIRNHLQKPSSVKKSLEELLVEGRERWGITIAIKPLSTEMYEIITLHESVRLFVVLDRDMVDFFEVTSLLTVNAKPIGRYVTAYFQHQFTSEKICSALGEKYDLISFIDYAFQLVEKCNKFFRIYELLYVYYNFQITENFKFAITTTSYGKQYISWSITGDLSQFNSIPCETLVVTKILGPEVDVAKVRRLVSKCEAGSNNCMEILREFIKKLIIYQNNVCK